MSKKTVWETLSKIDVNDKTEKKNGLTYLSWAWAWGVLKDHYPEATFEKHVQPNGLHYLRDESGYAFVQVSVIVEGKSSTELFPVLDYRNKAIQNPDSFSINTAFQRGLTKAISYHGLGHYIYAGEDIPQSDEEPRQAEVKVKSEAVPVKKKEAAPAASPEAYLSGPDAPLGMMINSFAWKDEDKVPRSVDDWGSWADVSCAWVATSKSDKMLNRFYTDNKAMFDMAKIDAVSKFDDVIECIKTKKEELKEKN